MTRKAILIVNTAKSDSQNTNIDAKRANQVARQYADYLGGLGEFSFETEALVDFRYQDATTRIDSQLARYSKRAKTEEDSCLLVYYFGHAVDRQDGLYFVFRNSDTSQRSTMVPFHWLTDKVIGYPIPRVLFVLDCCYAGAVQRNFQRSLNTTDVEYAVLCSAIPTQMANIQPGKSPFGVFSTFLFEGLKDVHAAETDSDNITVKSLFDYTRQMLPDKKARLTIEINTKQKPYYVEGGLGTYVLARTSITKNIDPRPNPKAPLKSYYSKYRWIATSVYNQGPITIDDLYQVVSDTEPIEFLTPVRGKNITKYEPVKLSTFESYVSGMQILGVLKDKEPLELTPDGQSMFRRNQALYNTVLLELIEHAFAKVSLSLDSLEIVIRQRLTTRRMPTASGVYRDVQNRLNISMSSSWFAVLLDLLAYTGFIRLTTQKTYYPYW